MQNNVYWVVGFFLLVVSVTLLWISRMTSYATQKPSNDLMDHEHVTNPEIRSSRYMAMPSLAPAAPQLTHPDPETETEEIDAKAPSAEIEQADVVNLPDNADVALNLKLASQLEIAGDLEGVSEFAHLALNDPRASSRQKEHAQKLLRRDSAI